MFERNLSIGNHSTRPHWQNSQIQRKKAVCPKCLHNALGRLAFQVVKVHFFHQLWQIEGEGCHATKPQQVLRGTEDRWITQHEFGIFWCSFFVKSKKEGWLPFESLRTFAPISSTFREALCHLNRETARVAHTATISCRGNDKTTIKCQVCFLAIICS